MFVTPLARSYRVMERGAGSMLTMLPTPPFSLMLYRKARIVEDYGGGNFAIPNCRVDRLDQGNRTFKKTH